MQNYARERIASADNIPGAVPKGPTEALPAGYLVAGKNRQAPKGRILIVRGIFTVFSLGMDGLGKKLKKLGYQVKVTPSANSYHDADILCDQILQSKTKSPLIIIGHSLGGELAPKLARSFAARNVDVDMLIMLDSTMPSAPPQNVKRCVNLYQSNASPSWARVFRGTDIQAKSTKTEMFNVDIGKLAGQDQTADINHFNIDANPWIHELIVEAVDLSHEPLQQATRATISSQPE
ncbi:MAG: thioesterase domain-containing protein [Mariniblastus sp.]|nr:thioesterase domain-containing protein [Mariniblastus sp.]